MRPTVELFPMLKRPAVYTPLVLAALVLLFMLSFIRPPTGVEAPDGGDLVNQEYPLLSLIFDSVHRGDGLPLWNPYQFAGQSIAANPQSTIFYPPAWIMALIGVPRGVGWLIIIHLWLGGWGMAQFARRLGASGAGALLGGIVYQLSALMAAHLEAGHFNYLLCQAWLPWMAAAYLWSIDRHNQQLPSLLGAMAFGMCILAGHPPMLYFGVIWLVMMAVYALVGIGVSFRVAARPLLVMLIGGAILSAALLLPVAEFTLRSTRTQEASVGFSNQFALPAAQLLTLLIPNFFGQPRLPDQGYWGLPFYQELTAYMGVLPLVAMLRVRRRPAAILLGAFVVIGIVVSIGIDAGLFSFLYQFLPGYSLFRVPSRALYFVIVGGAGLIALFVTDLQTAVTAERVAILRPAVRWLLPGIGLLLLIGSFVLSADFTAHSADPNPPWRTFYSANMVGLAAVAVAVTWVVLRLWFSADESWHRWLIPLTLVLVVVDLWHIAAPLVTVSAIDVPQMWKVMARDLPANADYRVMTVPNRLEWQAGSAYTRHLNVSGYDPLVSGRYQRLLDLMNDKPSSPFARLLGVRYVISDHPLDGLSLFRQDENWNIYEIANPIPHAYIAPDVIAAADDEAITQIESGAVDPLETALVGDRRVECAAGAKLPGAKAQITTYNPNHIEISTMSMQPGLLVLTDSYDPNWVVTVDNQPENMLRVFTALRGVCLPAGEHHVHFDYQPRTFMLGVIISAIGWFILVGMGVWAVLRSRHHHHPSQNGS